MRWSRSSGWMLGAGLVLLGASVRVAWGVLNPPPAGHEAIPYEGMLERDGIPVNSAADFCFQLFDAYDPGNAAVGTLAWSEQQDDVPVVAGRFSVRLGTEQALPAAVAGNTRLFLRVGVRDAAGVTAGGACGSAGDTEPAGYAMLAGRQQLGAAAFALAAGRGVAGQDFVVDGRLGVGTAGSADKLAVAGSVNATGNITTPAEVGAATARADRFLQRSATGDFEVGSTVMVRWGHDQAPAGLELLYRGVAMGGRYNHAAAGSTGKALCVAGGDSGPTPPTGSGDSHYALLYPIQAQDLYMQPASSGRESKALQCAVYRSPGPATEIWGTSTCPAGWTADYTGFAHGPSYAHQDKWSVMCLDSALVTTGVTGAAFGGIANAAVLFENWGVDATAYPSRRVIKCAVCSRR
ncbi:MAG: hypothetical protein HY904_22265 [Deltaproteobacteria bacterium]|nr:hypothetical protein [Deltaproteobacteria bacterium]